MERLKLERHIWVMLNRGGCSEGVVGHSVQQRENPLLDLPLTAHGCANSLEGKHEETNLGVSRLRFPDY
jgi:hypothetical protein